MLTPRFRTIRTTWVAVCVLLLIASLLTYNRTTNRDNDIFLYLAMMGLSFPAGYLVPVAIPFSGTPLHATAGNGVAMDGLVRRRLCSVVRSSSTRRTFLPTCETRVAAIEGVNCHIK